MLQYHKIISIVLGLLFLVVLQAFSNPLPIFRFLLPAFLGLLAITYFYNRNYLRSLGKENFWVLMRPSLLLTSGFLLFLVLPGPISRGFFFVATVAMIATFEILLANYSENLMLNEAIITAFGFCFAFSRFAQDFPSFQYLYVLGVFGGLLLITRCFYEFIPHSNNAKWLNALVVAFLSAQIFWAASFLPFHFSVLAILMVNFFYAMLALNYYRLFNTLNLQKIKFHLALSGISLALVLSATPWRIID